MLDFVLILLGEILSRSLKIMGVEGLSGKTFNFYSALFPCNLVKRIGYGIKVTPANY